MNGVRFSRVPLQSIRTSLRWAASCLPGVFFATEGLAPAQTEPRLVDLPPAFEYRSREVPYQVPVIPESLAPLWRDYLRVLSEYADQRQHWLTGTLQQLDLSRGHSTTLDALTERARKLAEKTSSHLESLSHLSATLADIQAKVEEICRNHVLANNALERLSTHLHELGLLAEEVNARLIPVEAGLFRMRQLEAEFSLNLPYFEWLSESLPVASGLNATCPNADIDGDGISNEVEWDLLGRFRPVVRLHHFTHWGPISIEEFRTRSGTAPNGNLNITNYYGTLSDGRVRSPARIYGRVSPETSYLPQDDFNRKNLLLVQYFILFLENQMNPPLNSGFNLGYHQGDWLAVTLIVDATDRTSSRVLFAHFHNHGRQFHVETDAIEWAGTRPTVYCEFGTNEPWPNGPSKAAGSKSWPAKGVTSNLIFQDKEFGPIHFGGEGDVVKAHSGLGPRLDLPVVDVGEVDSESSDARPIALPDGKLLPAEPATGDPKLEEARFLLQFSHRWGTTDRLAFGLHTTKQVAKSNWTVAC